MMKKFLTILVLGLAVFAVSCGDPEESKDVSQDELNVFADEVTEVLYVDSMPADADAVVVAVGDAFNSVLGSSTTTVGDGTMSKYVAELTKTDGKYTDIAVLDSYSSSDTETVVTITLTAEKDSDGNEYTLASSSIKVTVTKDTRTEITIAATVTGGETDTGNTLGDITVSATGTGAVDYTMVSDKTAVTGAGIAGEIESLLREHSAYSELTIGTAVADPSDKTYTYNASEVSASVTVTASLSVTDTTSDKLIEASSSVTEFSIVVSVKASDGGAE